MARPVIAASTLAASLDVEADHEIVYAQHAHDYVAVIDVLLRDPERSNSIGRAARKRVLEHYGWDAHLGQLDAHLASLLEGGHA